MNNYLNSIWNYQGEQSRNITPENKYGEKGKAAMSASKLGVGRKGSPSVPINPNETITLAEIEGPGIIRHIWMTVPDKTTAGSFVLRDLILRMYWDDESTPSVEVPLGDFFCNGFGQSCEVNSLPIVVNPTAGMNSYFEMPFRKKAKITLTSEHPNFIKHIFYTFSYALTDVPDDALYFHAKWNRERSTKKGIDYTLIDNIKGHGYYVGTYMALCALERYWWGEGEFKFYLDDDQEFPTITSTGAEDYFGGAWAFHKRNYGELPYAKNFNTLFMGYPFQSKRDSTRDYFSAGKPNPNSPHGFGDDALPMHGLYRWHLPDPISFHKNLRVTFQDLGNDDIKLYEREDDISTVAYWYQNEPHNKFKNILNREDRLPR
ncbi:MAG: DUF2961 domain-containing protein [Lactobacillus sp.]|uniref:glycoside hydrolase family 172 protein n=1 Tax=Bombilactobacillus bombi TaxID=1303590 RepID=UPI000E56D32F|nr:glycoside hydrolase family 172 protein [Bombilactobacillus bombi]AXX65071.1 DUF2961 domain-containing protein [Bombilactobacillus bombi]MCO6541122.1 DUF2961 domain-containing protein [Lactobacillus sp.]MCO6543382.1 DUF2961 domain-containing protein [Lactobacillus sp.]